MTDDILLSAQIDAQLDHTASPDANVQHLRHLLLGYRTAILDPHIRPTDSPFHSGGARDNSWQTGRRMAEEDLLARPVVTCT